ncbi:MAG: nicotinate phosphoribosyltransferase, partial [bacterium]
SEDIDYLRSLRFFDEGFLNFLQSFRFTGEVWAIPEGEVFFPPEPVLEIRAPLIEAQIIETFLLNQVNFQSLIASKAGRIVLQAQKRDVIDFSPRRDHGVDASLKVARASYIAGCIGTSNVLAGALYHIPVYGTMAHSYVMAFPDELTAFRTFVQDFPDHAFLLIDTYDTIKGAYNAVTIARELEAHGKQLKGVRIDSGDLLELSRKVRRILDDAGFYTVKILASGDLNEYKISELVQQNAPIDAFGVGTELGTSADAPFLGGVYKLVEEANVPRIKLSQGKVTLPGVKQVYRFFTPDDFFAYDVITLRDAPPPGGNCYPLLKKVMEKGKVCEPLPPLQEIQRKCQETLKHLPPPCLELYSSCSYPVHLSPELSRLLESLVRSFSSSS